MINFKKFKNGESYIGQSDWIGDIYNELFSHKKDGFLVEIGVGCVLDWSLMGRPRILNQDEEILQGKSTTIELIEYGWSGLYIEPIKEFLYNELNPLFKKILKGNKDRVKLVPLAASDFNGYAKIVSNETLNVTPNYDDFNLQKIEPYNYQGRVVECKKTSEILSEYSCPKEIDVMSIDVEGFELRVLKGIDFSKHSPKLIFIEIDKTSIDSIMSILPKEYKVVKHDSLNAAIIKY